MFAIWNTVVCKLKICLIPLIKEEWTQTTFGITNKSIFLTHHEKASYLSRKLILFTAYGGLPWHSTQTQFSHVQHRVPKANHWNSQATAPLSFAATHNTQSTSQSSLWATGSQNVSPGKENYKSHAGATFKSSAKLKQNQRKHILESITIKQSSGTNFP